MAAAKNPFAILGIAPSFSLDASDMERRQRELSKALHPDRHSGEAPAARRAALSEAIEVNEAFRRLRDPITRAEALLALLGQAVDERGNTGAALPPAFLMQVMEEREQLAAVHKARDRQGLTALVKQIREQAAELHATLAEQFAALLLSQAVPFDAATSASQARPETAAPAAGDARLASLTAALTRLRYTQKILDEAGAIEDELDAG